MTSLGILWCLAIKIFINAAVCAISLNKFIVCSPVRTSMCSCLPMNLWTPQACTSTKSSRSCKITIVYHHDYFDIWWCGVETYTLRTNNITNCRRIHLKRCICLPYNFLYDKLITCSHTSISWLRSAILPVIHGLARDNISISVV